MVKMSYGSSLIQELKDNGITHQGVLDAIKKVPREAFISSDLQYRAYDNTLRGSADDSKLI